MGWAEEGVGALTRPRSRQVERLCYSVAEAADALGIGETVFRKEVLPSLPIVGIGTVPRVAVDDLRRWVDEHKAIASALPSAPAAAGPSVGRSTGSAKSRLPVSATARRLAAKVERCTRRDSKGSASVVPLHGSRRRSPEHG